MSDFVSGAAVTDAKQTFDRLRTSMRPTIKGKDEINRATPKTQSALLEVMDRAKVTIDGEPHDVGSPFMVFATQNPVDYEGTFPLPESQMDRFLMRLHLGYPKEADELDILRTVRHSYDSITLNAVATRDPRLERRLCFRWV